MATGGAHQYMHELFRLYIFPVTALRKKPMQLPEQNIHRQERKGRKENDNN